jgi:hypothetical protein
MLATNQYKPEVRPASILPALDVSSVAWFINPDGSTRTGQIETLEMIDGTWWAACRYELIPGKWVLENRHAFNFFAGVGPEFALQLRQDVWFKRGNIWQAAKVSDFYLECGEWFGVVEWTNWFGLSHDELPIAEIRTTQPELDEDPEYSVWCDDRNDYEYENQRDSR